MEFPPNCQSFLGQMPGPFPDLTWRAVRAVWHLDLHLHGHLRSPTMHPNLRKEECVLARRTPTARRTSVIHFGTSDPHCPAAHLHPPSTVRSPESQLVVVEPRNPVPKVRRGLETFREVHLDLLAILTRLPPLSQHGHGEHAWHGAASGLRVWLVFWLLTRAVVARARLLKRSF